MSLSFVAGLRGNKFVEGKGCKCLSGAGGREGRRGGRGGAGSCSMTFLRLVGGKGPGKKGIVNFYTVRGKEWARGRTSGFSLDLLGGKTIMSGDCERGGKKPQEGSEKEGGS